MRRNGKGFTLMELLVVVAIIGILVGILVPALAIARQLAQLGACKGNVKGIHTAIKMYETSENRLPLMRNKPASDASVNEAPTDAMTTDDAYSDTTDAWATLGDQAMQNMWLLIINNNLGETGFKCPGDSDWVARDATGKYGWSDPYQYSYGIQWPYKSNAAGTANGAPFRSNMSDGLVILADYNPVVDGASVGLEGDSDNHGSHGTVVLNWSGTANAHKDNSLAGVGGDDIYTGGETPTAGTMPDNTETSDYDGGEDTSIALPGR